MANPIAFKPKLVDPRQELIKRLEEAPLKHAEALLVLMDTLQTAHDNGTLDLVQGLVGGRDMIAGKLAEYAKMPGGIAAIRNLIAAGKILMALDPETLDMVSKSLVNIYGQHRAEAQPPSLFQLARRAMSEDSRRGLSFLTLLLGSLGKSLKPTPESADL